MPTWEMEISRTQKRRVCVEANSLREAEDKARDGFKTILVNNQDPWEYQYTRVELVDFMYTEAK